jgi:hypothetical protein
MNSRQNRTEKRTEERIAEQTAEMVLARLSPDAAEGIKVTPKEETLSISQIIQFVRFMRFSRRMTASAILAAALGALYEYFTLMGVVDVSPARVVLFGAWFFATLFVSEMLLHSPWQLKIKFLIGAVAAFGLGLGAFEIDHWTVGWKNQHKNDSPPEIHDISQTVHGIDNKIDQIRTQNTPPQVVQASKPSVAPRSSPSKAPTPSFVPNSRGFLALEIVVYKPDSTLAAGHSVTFNTVYTNRGGGYVHNADENTGVFVVTVLNVNNVDSEVKETFKQGQSKVRHAYSDLAPGDYLWGSATTGELTQDLVDQILSGKSRIYLMGHAQWIADGIPDYADHCMWLQRPQGAQLVEDRMVWRRC